MENKKGYNRKQKIYKRDINIRHLISILFNFFISEKNILFTIFLLIAVVSIKSYLEVLASEYFGEICGGIEKNDLSISNKNFNKYLFVIIGYTIMFSITHIIAIPMIKRVFTRLAMVQVEAIFQLNYQKFKSVDIMYYINNLNRAAKAVSDLLDRLCLSSIYVTMTMVFSSIKLFQIFGFKTSLIFVFVMFIFIFMTISITKFRIKYHLRANAAENKAQKEMYEKFNNRDTVLMMEMYEVERNNLEKSFFEFEKNNVTFAMGLPILNFVQDFIFFTFYFVLMFYMLNYQKLNITHFSTTFSLLVNVRHKINNIGFIFQDVNKTAANVTLGYFLLEKISNNNKKENCGEIKKIDFRNFSKGREGKIFNSINLQITNPGSYVIIGPNGSGKSTFIKALLGFYDKKEGILINDVPLNNVKMKDFHRRSVYSTQNCELFQGTILYNLQYGNNKSLEEIKKLCKELNIEDMILKKPEGYSYDIGINANKLSGGEKQKIAIARAILRDADLYIFDEPTAAIDEHSELFLLKKITEILKNKTLLFIIHNIQLIPLFDKVIFIKDSNIYGPDNFVKLLELNNEFGKFMKSN